MGSRASDAVSLDAVSLIGERACRAGHSVHYTSAHDLLAQLRAARADASLERRMLRFTAPDLLIVDDLGRR
jgi:DNA replication protein DnaC